MYMGIGEHGAGEGRGGLEGRGLVDRIEILKARGGGWTLMEGWPRVGATLDRGPFILEGERWSIIHGV